MLADYATAVDGKLYISGGGFDRILVGTPGEEYRCCFAAILLIPWDQTNEKIPVTIGLEDIDRNVFPFKGSGQVVAGRSPDAKKGQDTLISLAGPVTVPTDEERDLVLRMRLGTAERAVKFYVRHRDSASH